MTITQNIQVAQITNTQASDISVSLTAPETSKQHKQVMQSRNQSHPKHQQLKTNRKPLLTPLRSTPLPNKQIIGVGG